MSSTNLLLPTVAYSYSPSTLSPSFTVESVDCGHFELAAQLKQSLGAGNLGYSAFPSTGFTTFSDSDSATSSSSSSSSPEAYFTDHDSPASTHQSPVIQVQQYQLKQDNNFAHTNEICNSIMSASAALNYAANGVGGDTTQGNRLYNYTGYPQQELSSYHATRPQYSAPAQHQHTTVPAVNSFPAMSSIETPQGTFYFVPNSAVVTQQHALPMATSMLVTPAAASNTPVGVSGPAGIALAMPTPIHPAMPLNLDVTEYSPQHSPAEEWASQDASEEQEEQKPEATTGLEASPMSSIIAPKVKSASNTSNSKGKKGGKKTAAGKNSSRRFMCPHEGCGRAFARNFNMQSHLKSHLGIRDCE